MYIEYTILFLRFKFREREVGGVGRMLQGLATFISQFIQTRFHSLKQKFNDYLHFKRTTVRSQTACCSRIQACVLWWLEEGEMVNM